MFCAEVCWLQLNKKLNAKARKPTAIYLKRVSLLFAEPRNCSKLFLLLCLILFLQQPLKPLNAPSNSRKVSISGVKRVTTCANINRSFDCSRTKFVVCLTSRTIKFKVHLILWMNAFFHQNLPSNFSKKITLDLNYIRMCYNSPRVFLSTLSNFSCV